MTLKMETCVARRMCACVRTCTFVSACGPTHPVPETVLALERHSGCSLQIRNLLLDGAVCTDKRP